MAIEKSANSVVDSLCETGKLAMELARTIEPDLNAAVSIITDCIKSGGKVLVCGNGGSAAEAQHFAGEMVGRFLFNRPAAAAIALSTDTSILTAVGNDYGFEKVFSRQVEALGKPGDVLLGFTTSGRSQNILLAVEEAQNKNMKSILMIGATKHKELEHCAVCLCIPSEITPRIQEMHLALMHTLCERVENNLFTRGCV